MTVNDLIQELEKVDGNLPICINNYMGFVEANEKSILVERKKYICFPFTGNDEFQYINLRGIEYGEQKN